MAIAPLIIAVRTFGARQLNNLANDFAQVAARIRVSWNRTLNNFAARGGIPGAFRRLPANFRQLARAVGSATRALWGYIIASRAAQAASDGLARALTSAAFWKYASIIALIASASVPLVGIIGNLLGAIQLVAPAIATAAIAFGVLKLATQGVSDALKAGLSGDTEEYEKALKKLAPSARTAVGALVMLQKEWKKTQQAVQQKFFEGFAQDVADTSRAVQPLADKWFPRIATSFQEMINGLASGLQRFAKDGRGEAVFRNISLAIDNLTRMVKPLARAFGDVLEVASPRFESLTSDAATLAEKFADWIREMKESGKLGEWLDEALEALKQIKEIGGNVLGILGGIFKVGEDDGKTLLENLKGITETFEKWVKSAEGQEFIDNLGKFIGLMIASQPVWEKLLGFLTLCINQFEVMGIVGSAAWDGARAALSFFVQFAVNCFMTFLNAAVGAFGWIPGIGPKLKSARDDFSKWAQDIIADINRIPKNVTVTLERKVLGPSLGGQFGYRGFATGTRSAPRGLALVGETGKPELIDFQGGERVYNPQETAAIMSRTSGGSIVPSGGGGQLTVVLTAAPSADSMVASMLTKMIRVGLINLKVVNGRVVSA